MPVAAVAPIFLRWADAGLDALDSPRLPHAWRAHANVAILMHKLAVYFQNGRALLAPSAAASAQLLARCEAAAGAGHGCAAARLYVAHRDGEHGAARDASKAAKWAARTRELGHAVPADGEGESHG